MTKPFGRDTFVAVIGASSVFMILFIPGLVYAQAAENPRRIEVTVYVVWYSGSPGERQKPASEFDTEEEAERTKENLETTLGVNGQRLYFNVEVKPERRVKMIYPPTTSDENRPLGSVDQVPGRPAKPVGKYSVWVFKTVKGKWVRQEDRTLFTDDEDKARDYVASVKKVSGWTATSNLPKSTQPSLVPAQSSQYSIQGRANYGNGWTDWGKAAPFVMKGGDTIWLPSTGLTLGDARRNIQSAHRNSAALRAQFPNAGRSDYQYRIVDEAGRIVE